jgi:hypothetical protein
MKKPIVFLLFIVAFISCETYNFNIADYGKIGNNKKQIDQILLDGKLSKKFNYDTENRISQIINYYESESDTVFISYNTDNQASEIRSYKYYIEKYIYQDKKLTQSITANTQNSEWNIKLVYHYNNNRIDYADRYSSDNLIGKINFEYDKKGNTISRIEYSTGEVYKVEEFHYTYDDKQNPIIDLPNTPIDIMQTNNPIISYRYSLVMSSLPTEYGIDYVYNNDGFPVSAKKYNVKYPDKILYSYTYIYK